MDDTPATISDEIAAMAVEWAPITAILGGTRAMREAGKLYLPQNTVESDINYSGRVKRTTLFNGFRRTVATLSAKPFSDPLRLEDDVPTIIKGYCEDIDLEGRNLQAFAHDVFGTALAYGLSHILVDYPPSPVGQTLADQRTSGARPYFVHICPYQVLGWKSKRINGAETLTQLRFMETVQVETGKWTTQNIQQVRVLEPDSYRLYRLSAKQEVNNVKQWVLFAEGPVSIGVIPLATIYGDRTDFMMARPPLLDLAYMNIEHWQSSSDQSNILHVARVPILFASGFENSEIKIGATSAVNNDDPASKLEYVDSGRAAPAIEAGRTSIKDLEERMSLFGAQMLIKVPGTRTATETSIDTAEAESALSLMALNMQDALEYALEFLAKWDGIADGGSVKICDDFTDDSEDQFGLDAIARAKELGVLSAETVFGELQRHDVISQELTWEQEKSRLKEEGPPVGNVAGALEAPATAVFGASTPKPAVAAVK